MQHGKRLAKEGGQRRECSYTSLALQQDTAGVQWNRFQGLRLQLRQGASQTGDVLIHHMRIDLSCTDIPVAEQLLHDADVGAGLKQVGGKRVSQGMRRYPFFDPGPLGGS